MNVYKDKRELLNAPTTYYLFNSFLDASKFFDEKRAVGKLDPYKSAWVIASEEDEYWNMPIDLLLSYLVDGIIEEVKE